MHGATIATAVVTDDPTLRAATEQVISNPPEWLLATTGIGMRTWFETARAWNLDAALREALADTRVLARGPKSASAVESLGIKVWRRAPSDRLSDLVDMLADVGAGGDTVVVQLYGEPSSGVVGAIVELGAEVVEVATYLWKDPAEEGPALRLAGAVAAARVDAVTFTSAPALRNLLTIAARHGLDEWVRTAFNQRVVAACVGPACAEAARSVGIENPTAPAVGRLGLLIRELTEELARRRLTLVMAGQKVVLQGRLAIVEGEAVHLGGRERDVLRVLGGFAGEMVPRAGLLRAVWGEGAHDSHVMEVTISRLRSKLGKAGEALETVPSLGYRLDAAS